MDEDILINKIFKNTSQKGVEYLSLLTDKGKMNCWNKQIFPDLKNGRRLLVKVEEKGGYKNILGIEKELTPVFETKFKEAREDKSASMLTSYVKDIVVAMIEKGIVLSEPEGIKLAEQVADWYNAIKNKTGGENDNKERPADPESP